MQPDGFRRRCERIRQVLSRRIFFVVGAQKSGTTWVQKLLDAHPEIVCSGEGHFADWAAAGLGKFLDNYNSGLALVAERVYQNEPYYGPIEAEDAEYLIAALAALLWSQRAIPEGVKCIGDKTPAQARFLPRLQRIFPGARFIHIVRDGRDVLVSRVKHAQRVVTQVVRGNPDEYGFSARTEEYARDWARTVGSAAAFAQRHPAVCHTVTYEALKQDAEGTLEEIFRFLEVDPSADVVARCRDAGSFETLSGGRKPGEEDTRSFLRKGVVGDWRNHLDEATLEAFERIAGPLMTELGYR